MRGVRVVAQSMSNRDGWGIWVMEADGANPRLLVAVSEGLGKLWDQDCLSWGPCGADGGAVTSDAGRSDQAARSAVTR